MILGNQENNEEYAEIYQVAHMYYNLNMVQADIAKKLYLSKPKVSRLLMRAKELGIVEIKVHPIINELPHLEKKLCQTFGLKDAIVISNHVNKLELIEDMLIEFSAQYVSRLLETGGILGVTGGRTVNGILNKLVFTESAETEIIQLTGNTTNAFSMQDTAIILTHIAGQNNSVKTATLQVPLYVNDLYLKEVLLQSANVHALMQKMSKCRIILTGVNALEKGADYQISWHGLMGPHHLNELTERRAVGNICAQYYDINGIKVTSEWNAKIIAMNLHDFLRVEYRIGVAVGLDKLKAIYGALHGKILNVLITDANTASDLIEAEEKKQIRKRMEV